MYPLIMRSDLKPEEEHKSRKYNFYAMAGVLLISAIYTYFQCNKTETPSKTTSQNLETKIEATK